MRGALRALDMRRLQTLERVAARASFSKAADELHFTQSAVSQQIAALERDLGVRLINRKPVSLTAPGQMLCERYSSALAELVAAEAELESFREGGTGLLRIASVRPAASHVVPSAVAAFAARFPSVVVHLDEQDAPEAIGRLKRGEADIGLTFGLEQSSVGAERLRWVRLTRERICVAVPAAHAVSRRPAVRLAELVGERFLHSPGVGIAAEDLAAAFGGPVPTGLIVIGDNPDAVHGMVARGVGLALIGELDTQNHPGVEYVRLVEPALHRSVYAAVPASARTSATVCAMLDELANSAAPATTSSQSRRWELARPAAVG